MANVWWSTSQHQLLNWKNSLDVVELKLSKWFIEPKQGILEDRFLKSI
jgi:hypothetical protein